MKQFDNVAIEIEGNSYFDGAVTSRTVHFADGSRKTLGFMQIGEFEFGTVEAELMEITAGKLEVLLPQSDTWEKIQSGESFNVPADSKFRVKVETIVDYCCSYL